MQALILTLILWDESKPFLTKLMLHEYSPSKFIARQVLKIGSAKHIASQIPFLVSRFFHNDESSNSKFEELSSHLLRAEHRIDILIEKMMLMLSTIVLGLAGVLFLKFYSYLPWSFTLAVILFCMAAATFLLAIFIKSKR